MTNLFRILIAFLLAGVVASIAACLGETQAKAGSSSCTECAALSARITALEARVPALELATRADALVVRGAAVAHAKAEAQAAAAGDQVVGTLVGTVATNGKANTASAIVGASATGYLFVVPGNQGAQPTVSVEGPIYFEGAGCSGRAYVTSSGSGAVISRIGARQGFVFRVLAGSLNEITDQARQYWMVRAGTSDTVASWSSRYTNVDDCTTEFGSSSGMFEVELNDPIASGIESSPFAGDVVLGSR